MNKSQKLQHAIEKIRMKMIRLAHTKGLNHPDTIHVSQELDLLIYKYQRSS